MIRLQSSSDCIIGEVFWKACEERLDNQAGIEMAEMDNGGGTHSRAKHGTSIFRFYHSLAQGKEKQVAVVARARKLLLLVLDPKELEGVWRSGVSTSGNHYGLTMTWQHLTTGSAKSGCSPK